MKFVTIADTHNQHDAVSLPKGDVLIHAGDVSMRGSRSEVADFLLWFHRQDFKHKIMIAGNHDWYFESATQEQIDDILPEGIIYLNDSGVTIEGIKIWGSPITPWFHDWAFNRERGAAIKRHWDLIPAGTDIVVTHGPVYHTLDEVIRGGFVGCEDLFYKMHEIKPKVHICGHIHEAYGQIEKGGIKFINASVLNHRYVMTNEPIVFEL